MLKSGNLFSRLKAQKFSFEQFYKLFKNLGLQGATDFYKILTAPASRILDEWFESDIIKATLVTDGLIGAMLGPHDSGTGYILLHHVMGGLDGRSSSLKHYKIK